MVSCLPFALTSDIDLVAFVLTDTKSAPFYSGRDFETVRF